MDEFRNQLDQLRQAVLNDPGNREDNFLRIFDQIEIHLHAIGSEGGIDGMNVSAFPNATNAEKSAYVDIYNFLAEFHDTLDLAELGDTLLEYREMIQDTLNAPQQQQQQQQDGGRKRKYKKTQRKNKHKKTHRRTHHGRKRTHKHKKTHRRTHHSRKRTQRR